MIFLKAAEKRRFSQAYDAVKVRESGRNRPKSVISPVEILEQHRIMRCCLSNYALHFLCLSIRKSFGAWRPAA